MSSHGELSWIDLSTFDVPLAQHFYHSVFGWQYAAESPDYFNCLVGGTPCAGLFEMPEFFHQIRMPSFWMTYIAVDDVAVVVEQAKQLGGKVELEQDDSRGKVALIRDPLGAGFTCYQGSARSAIATRTEHGRWLRSELVISNLEKVQPFYQGLFGWTFTPEADDRYAIVTAGGEQVGAVQVASNDIKGDKEFWAVFIAVDDAQAAISRAQQAGGRLIYDYANAHGTHYLIEDSQGAALYLTSPTGTKSNTAHSSGSSSSASPPTSMKWRSLIGLIMIYLAILYELNWLWGVLFLFWVIPDLRSGVTYFIEPLRRDEHPALYWAVMLTWIGLAIYALGGGT